MADAVLSSLDPQQLATVTDRQKTDLPTYYSAAQQNNIQISRDFEAFLILSSKDSLNSALTWITQANDLGKPNKLRDALNGLALTQEISNSKALMDAYASVLTDFNKFKSSFVFSNTFNAVPEVQLFLQDLQGQIDELVSGQDRAFFDNTVAQVAQRAQQNTNVSQPQLQELNSWRSVLTSYIT
jgi:hypothetical protein